jgi:hypothetical protein
MDERADPPADTGGRGQAGRRPDYGKAHPAMVALWLRRHRSAAKWGSLDGDVECAVVAQERDPAAWHPGGLFAKSLLAMRKQGFWPPRLLICRRTA